MIDPRLTEFTEDQLRVMLRIALKEQADLNDHVKSLTQWNLEEIHSETIQECKVIIDTLELWATQLAWAVIRVKQKDTVASN